jgi:glycosyltransferase involved in cell wall biosynthesis
MHKPFISYLVTTKNSTNQLKDLLTCIEKYIDGNECVILDDNSDNVDTIKILEEYKNKIGFVVCQHALNNHYSNHKNYGKSMCHGSYIFQLDDDELPNETLMENIIPIISANPDVECFLIPRINDFIGVTQEHANRWGWRLTNYENRQIVNFPDFQFRLFKNLPHLNWERPLHEKIEGAKVTTKLPEDYELSIIHNKTIEKQVATNLRYNKDFSDELNKGFKI